MKLCKLFFEGDKEFIIRSNISGKIIEINEDIIDEKYSTINNYPETDGFFFIINLPSFNYNL